MLIRSRAMVVAALVAWACYGSVAWAAAPAAGKAAASHRSAYEPWNIKREVVKMEGLSGFGVRCRTSAGVSLCPTAFNPGLILLKDKRLATAEDYKKPGQKFIIYYHAPGFAGDFEVLWAATDAKSEILLAELRAKPVLGTFKSWDAASRKLTVQTDGRAQTYVVVPPVMVFREQRSAKLGQPNEKKQRGYAAGDKLVLVLTADRKQVRFVMDKQTYDHYVEGVRAFPLPPMSKLAK